LKNTLEEVITELEAANEGSAELDLMIEKWCGAAPENAVVAVGGPQRWTSGAMTGQPCHLPRYTTSIDAALSLVPDGWHLLDADSETFPPEEMWRARVWHQGEIENESHEGESGVLPIAICIAALKALQQEEIDA
jgi:hypothetical protein